MPLLARDSFGPKDYTKIFSYMQIGIGLIGGFSNPIIASFYEETGDFNASLWFGVGLCVACAVLFAGVAVSRKRLKFEGPGADVEPQGVVKAEA